MVPGFGLPCVGTPAAYSGVMGLRAFAWPFARWCSFPLHRGHTARRIYGPHDGSWLDGGTFGLHPPAYSFESSNPQRASKVSLSGGNRVSSRRRKS